MGLGVAVVEYAIYTVGFYGVLVGLAIRERRVEGALRGRLVSAYLNRLFPASILSALVLAAFSVGFGSEAAAKIAFYLLVLSICLVVLAATRVTVAFVEDVEDT